MIRITVPAVFSSVSVNEHNYNIRDSSDRGALALPRIFTGSSRFSPTETSPIYDFNETMSCLSKTQVIVNNTSAPIAVKDISNVVKVVKPAAKVSETEGIVIYNIHVIENPFFESRVNIHNENEYALLCRRLRDRYKASEDTNDFHVEAHLVYESALKYGADIIKNQIGNRGRVSDDESWSTFKSRRYLFVTVRFDVQNTYVRLNNNIYVENMGLLFSTLEITKVPEHPLIDISRDLGVSSTKTANAINISVLFVDHDDNLGKRFMCLFGTVIELIPVKDYTRSQGVSICLSSYGNMKNIHVPLDEIDTCGFVFKTRECAVSGTDSDKIFMQKLKETEQKILEAKQDLEKEKLENEVLKQRIAKEELNAKAIYEQMERIHKLKMDEIKSRMEEVKEEQTRTSGFIKVGIAVIGAAITIGTIVIKASQSSSSNSKS